MKYENSATNFEVDLSDLSDDKKAFFKEALTKFRKGVDWVTFEDFVFGSNSPVYSGHKSHLDVFADPLYLALEDMWLELGVKQGMVRRPAREEKSNEQRRRQGGSRQAAQRRNAPKDRHVASSR